MTTCRRLLNGLTLACLLLMGCSNAASGDPVTSSTTAEVTGSTTQASTPAALVEVESLADEVRAGVPEITDVLVYDETNDPNDLLGRPNGYAAAASLIDQRATGAEGIGRGAVLEVWPTGVDAQARADYIAELQKGNTLLGSEYHHLRDTVLLRVSGELPPSVNEQYALAFSS